jgi:YVTN family beta-propeller protein
VGEVPEALALHPDGSELFVANAGSSSVSVVDVSTNQVADTVSVGAAPMGVAVVSVPAAFCAGDCRDRGQVEVIDLMQAVAIALQREPPASCSAADPDGGGTVTVDELLAAVRNALTGCPS